MSIHTVNGRQVGRNQSTGATGSNSRSGGFNTSSNSNIINYNPQTGARLKAGETALDAQGRKFTQGTRFDPSMSVDNLSSNTPSLSLPNPPQGNANDYASYLTNAMSDATATPQTTDITNPQETTTKNSLYSLIGLAPKPENLLDSYNKLEKQAGIVQKENLRNQYQNQLNTIVTNSQADQLRVTGQGRGIPEAIIGGQQAQIAKEAAINALPVQAALSAAQGDLDTAQKHLDTMFTIFQQDATNQYNYKKSLFDSVFSIASQDQQRQLMLADKASDRTYAEQQSVIQNANQIALEAAKNGAGAATLSAIANAARQKGADIGTILSAAGRFIRPPSSGASIPTIKTINGVDYQWNPKTGTWEQPSITGGGVQNEGQLAHAQGNIEQINSLTSNFGLKSSVGTSFLTRSPQGFWGTLGSIASVAGIPSVITSSWNKLTGKQQDFIGGVEQVRNQLTLDALANAKKNGATFGALSDGERGLLEKSGTLLSNSVRYDKNKNVIGYNMTESSFKKELDKINNYAKLDYLIRGGDPSKIGVVTHPDGTYWTTDSFGNPVQLR